MKYQKGRFRRIGKDQEQGPGHSGAFGSPRAISPQVNEIQKLRDVTDTYTGPYEHQDMPGVDSAVLLMDHICP